MLGKKVSVALVLQCDGIDITTPLISPTPSSQHLPHSHSYHLVCSLDDPSLSFPKTLLILVASLGVLMSRCSGAPDTSSSEEPWERIKQQRHQPKAKKRARRPQTPQEQFLCGVAAMARASAKISLSMPGVACSTVPLAGLAASMKAQGQQHQQQQQQEQTSSVSTCSGVQQEQQEQQEQPKAEDALNQGPRRRAPRGTANTFNGKRPPKNPAKLQLFMAEKAVWEREKEAARQQKKEQRQRQKKEPIEKQALYQAFMRAHLQEDNSAEAFSEAIKQYRSTILMKRPASSRMNVQTPTKKAKGKDEKETPEKDLAPSSGVPSESAASSSRK